ncbi:MAG: hypothetical protein CL565_00970 [Alphaproteobacteria bacterium]|nr:hypothetical protein [Alphaproteobacteria bacterium]|tara:strand:- start:467 stop:1084 length:618 start_codon:yes stop_codon:yes gene_type:complete
MQWHRLEAEKTEKLITSIVNAGGPALFTVNNSEAKCMRLPFFDSVLLYRITNNTCLPVFSMDFLGNGSEFFYIDGSFSPFEKVQQFAELEITKENIASFLQFYFFTVMQEDGEIYPVYKNTALPDLEDGNLHTTRHDVPEGGYTFEIEEDLRNDSFNVKTSLYYDGSLMVGNLEVSKKGNVEITGLKPLFGEQGTENAAFSHKET